MRRFLLFLFAISAISFSSGCVVARGGATGTVVDAETSQPIQGIETYYYVKRTSHWFGQEPYSRIVDAQVDRTNCFGDFSTARNWFWLMPFVHDLDEERIILNLRMRPDLQYRTFADGDYTEYWLKPAYLELLNPRYEGAVIDIHKAQPDERQLSGARVVSSAPGKYTRYAANQHQLSQIRLPARQEEMGP